MSTKLKSIKSAVVARSRSNFEFEVSRHGSYVASAITDSYRQSLIAEAFDEFIGTHGKENAAAFSALLSERLEGRGDFAGAKAVRKFKWS